MAATFVVEDGTGLATANSYASVATADQYHEDYTPTSTDWTSLATAVKELHLRIATQYLDARFKLMWKGERKFSTQALDWPRSFAESNDGFLIEDDEVPAALANATAALALKSYEAVTAGDSLLLDVSAGDGGLTAKRSKVGPLETEKRYGGVTSTQTHYTLALSLISDLVYSSGRIVRA